MFESFKKTDIDYNNLKGDESLLESLKDDFVKATQYEYNCWNQDEDGGDDLVGFGGICQEIAHVFSQVLDRHGIIHTDFEQITGEVHVYTIAVVRDGLFKIDIDPYRCETGGGYTWKKIPDVELTEDDIEITLLSDNPRDYEEYSEEY